MGSDASLEALLTRHINLLRSQVVDFSMLAAFSWSQMFVFPPYTDRSTVERVTGIKYHSDWRQHVPEGRDLVVFVARDGGGCYYEFLASGSSDAKWSFGPSAYTREGIPRDLARFAVKDFEGLPLLQLKSAKRPAGKR